jgi:hypothetical protein
MIILDFIQKFNTLELNKEISVKLLYLIFQFELFNLVYILTLFHQLREIKILNVPLLEKLIVHIKLFNTFILLNWLFLYAIKIDNVFHGDWRDSQN